MKIEVFCTEFCGNFAIPPMPYEVLDSLDKIQHAINYHIDNRHEHCTVTVVVTYP